jgi:hypothetical protein
MCQLDWVGIPVIILASCIGYAIVLYARCYWLPGIGTRK